MQLMNQKEQLEAKISESRSINEANFLKLKEEMEEDGKPSLQSVKYRDLKCIFSRKKPQKVKK